MISATVIASGTARCTWLTATVMTVQTKQRANHHVGPDALLDCGRIRVLHLGSPKIKSV